MMDEWHKQIENISSTAQKKIAHANTQEELASIYTELLGKKGVISTLSRALRTYSEEERRIRGPLLQSLRVTIESWYQDRLTAINIRPINKDIVCDITAYIAPTTYGGLHPYTHIITHIEDIFVSLGWSIVEGPEVEDEFHNFDALNIPPHHPAREQHDTFWLPTPHTLLRTHTSSVQVRTMMNRQPPLAICAPGRTFRHEATDATHDFVFMQCEGLFIDRNVSLAHLVGTIQICMQQLFRNYTIQVRLQPDYFPFVEPGLQFSVSCPFCSSGCSVCKKSQWIEIGGAGLVHPHVLRTCSIDPDIWNGFAFGFGIERIAMLLYHINDVRLFKTGKKAFLQQFAHVPQGK